MKNGMTEYKRIAAALGSVGFSPDGIECNEDNFKMEGETREGKVMICIMDLLLKMPEAINKGDPREIVGYIEGVQKETKLCCANDLDDFIQKYRPNLSRDEFYHLGTIQHGLKLKASDEK